MKLDFLLVLSFEGLCEVMLDDDTPCLHCLSSHTTDKLLTSVFSDLEAMNPEFFNSFIWSSQCSWNLLVAALLIHAESTLLGPGIKHITLAATGKRKMTKTFD